MHIRNKFQLKNYVLGHQRLVDDQFIVHGPTKSTRDRVQRFTMRWTLYVQGGAGFFRKVLARCAENTKLIKLGGDL